MEETQRKNELFSSIKPVKQGPILISTSDSAKKKSLGKLGNLFFFLLLLSAFYNYKTYSENKTLKSDISQKKTEIKSAKSPNDILATFMVLPEESLKEEKMSDGSSKFSFEKYDVVVNPNLGKVVGILPKVEEKKPEGQVAAAEIRATQGKIKIEIRNASGVSGAAAAFAKQFSGVGDVEVSILSNSKNMNQKGKTLVNLTGKDLSILTKLTGLQAVPAIPSGEAYSSADVLILIGK